MKSKGIFNPLVYQQSKYILQNCGSGLGSKSGEIWMKRGDLSQLLLRDSVILDYFSSRRVHDKGSSIRRCLSDLRDHSDTGNKFASLHFDQKISETGDHKGCPIFVCFSEGKKPPERTSNNTVSIDHDTLLPLPQRMKMARAVPTKQTGPPTVRNYWLSEPTVVCGVPITAKPSEPTVLCDAMTLRSARNRKQLEENFRHFLADMPGEIPEILRTVYEEEMKQLDIAEGIRPYLAQTSPGSSIFQT